MDRIDRLTEKVKEKAAAELLKRNNPYMGKSFHELLSMMRVDASVGVPENGTLEKDQFNVALLEACRNRKKYEIIAQVAGGDELTAPEPEPVRDPDQEVAAQDRKPEPMEAYYRLYHSDRNIKPGYLR